MWKRLMSRLFPAQKAWRAVLVGEHGRTVLEEQSLTIGRLEPSQLIVKDRTISRRHAQICFEKGEYFLKDIGSASGSMLNGQRLETEKSYHLKHGDHILLGQAVLTFLIEPIPDEEVPSNENEATDVEQGQEQMTPSPSFPVHTYKVLKQGTEVLVFTTKPGYMGSTAFRSPLDPLPPPHPFLSGYSLHALSEHELHFVLRYATSVEDFLWLLHEQGFEVIEEATGVPFSPSAPGTEQNWAVEKSSEMLQISHEQNFEVVEEAAGDASTPGAGENETVGEASEMQPLAQGVLLHDGRYQIEKLLVAGGIGAVYHALDSRFARSCAVQEILNDSENDADGAQAMQRFAREAMRLLDPDLKHSCLPRLRDFFTEGKKHYLIMDLPEGQRLSEVMKHGPISELRARHFAHQICSMLVYLHCQSPPIIYGDLDPLHIIVMDRDDIQVLGFGMVGVFQPQRQAARMRTPGYVPPERLHGTPEPRSDLYALGATLHRLLTGHDAVKNQPDIFSFPSVRSLRPGITPHFDKIVMKALAPDPEQRWSSAEKMERAIMGRS